jgi:protoporphyrin/coproporphyrin ferrochelatase
MTSAGNRRAVNAPRRESGQVPSLGVLLMAYGSPNGPEQVEPYFTHIRGGRTPTAEAVLRLQQRYQLVGGRTPLLDITMQVRDALERRLNELSGNGGYRVYVGMKHWHPFIGEVLPQVSGDGIRELTALALAPHYSRISIGGYRAALDDALGTLPDAPALRFVDSWHMNPRYLALVAERLRETLEQWPARLRGEVVTLFSAHSLPERIRTWNDPYEQQLLESCSAVAALAGIDHWRFAWQSAGETGEPWLGPDIVDVVQSLHDAGARHVLSVPIGFVSDHLEVLYDIDHEARRRSEALGMTLRRVRMPNADPAFVEALASVVLS